MDEPPGSDSSPPSLRERLRAVTVGPVEPLSTAIVLAEWTPDWDERFAREAVVIHRALGGRVLRLEHVGSTSVRGLAAKPIVDILLVVVDSADEEAYLPALEELGYALRIREPDWHEHRMLKSHDRSVNLHVFSAGVEEIERMLAFRDRLRADAADRQLYEATKRELAARPWTYLQEYADAKAEVVESILRRARRASPSGAVRDTAAAASHLHPSIVGQLGEWLVAARISLASGGDAHVFMPIADRGIDLYVHRRSTDAYTPVQVKARTAATGIDATLTLTRAELASDAVRVVVVRLDARSGDLLDPALVVDAATLRARARWSAAEGAHIVEVSLDPTERSEWHRFAVPVSGIADALSPPSQDAARVVPAAGGDQGRRERAEEGELALLAACAARPRLCVFRAAPDTEFVEYVVHHLDSGCALGVQVKTVGVDGAQGSGIAHVRLATFEPSPHAWLVAVGVERASGEPVDGCLLVPSPRVREVAREDAGTLLIEFRPSVAPTGSRLDPYRLPLGRLGQAIEEAIQERRVG